jgi:hypothetical protein
VSDTDKGFFAPITCNSMMCLLNPSRQDE